MSKKTLEHLSSLMDGELSQETGLFLTRRVCADGELGQTWQRYHLIRDCLRNSGESWTVSRQAIQIDELLPGETLPGGNPGRSAPGWLKPLSGLAVAATVAITAILIVAPQPETDGTQDQAQPFTSPNPIKGVNISQPASLSGGTQGAVSNNRMNNYLLRHNQVAGSVGRPGVVSLVPIVATQAEDGKVEPEVGPRTNEDAQVADGQP